MGYEISANEQAVAFGTGAQDLPPLLEWLSRPHTPTLQPRAGSSRQRSLSDRASAHIRRHPLQSLALAAAGGLIAGMLLMRG
jgi:hypothetical protein